MVAAMKTTALLLLALFAFVTLPLGSPTPTRLPTPRQ